MTSLTSRNLILNFHTQFKAWTFTFFYVHALDTKSIHNLPNPRDSEFRCRRKLNK